MKKHILLLSTVAVIVGAVAPAYAQAENGKKNLSERVGDLINRPELTIDRDKDSIETAVAAGCVISQTYNTQSANDFSVQFRIATSSGPEMFNVLVPHIKHANPASFPLANASETLQWTRLLDTFERAAATDRPISISYETVSRNVFGITIEWNRRCAS